MYKAIQLKQSSLWKWTDYLNTIFEKLIIWTTYASKNAFYLFETFDFKNNPANIDFISK